MDIGNLKINSARGEAGDWVGGLEGLGNARLKVRGLQNTDYIAAITRAYRTATRDQREGGRRNGDLKRDVADKITNYALLDHVLIDWDGLTEGGQPLPYSKEKAEIFLTSADYVVFRNAVVEAANRVVEESTDSVENLAGN